MMRYIAAIDYQHMDNGMFLTSLAGSISRQENNHAIIVHGDSPYTERVMQTGVMREEAKIRSIKDLNHRLIALFADQGISAIGINGYQRKFISSGDDELSLDTSFFERLPEQSVLLLSTLVWDTKNKKPIAIELAAMAAFLERTLEAESVFAFSTADKDEIFVENKPPHLAWKDLPAGFAQQNLPQEFHGFNQPLYLITARDFHHPLDNNNSVLIQ